MTPDRFREAIEQLGLGQVEAGLFLGFDERAVRRWAAGKGREIPFAVAMLLELMIIHGITVEQAEALIGE